MTTDVNNNDLGNLGELKACEFLIRHGWHLYLSVGGKGPVDILAYKEGRVLRCECKSSMCKRKNSSTYRVKLASVRYNRHKLESRKFDASKSDVCFLWVEPLNTLFIRDSAALANKTELGLSETSVPVISVYFGE